MAQLLSVVVLYTRTGMIEVDGFVTAGGRSSRMGTDKALLELGGRSMIEHVISALRQVTGRVTIIGNSPEYARFGLPVVPDSYKEIGPLEAIRTALTGSTGPWVVLAGCDLPFVTSELFRFLLDLTQGYQAVIPAGPNGRLEPLCAVYSTTARGEVERLILSGVRKVSPLFDRIRTRFVAAEKLRHLNQSELFFENVNTPDDYQRALETARRLSFALGSVDEPSS